jgi:CRP-like cAMP-binding protein
MVVGRLPFPMDSPAGLMTRIMLGNLPPPGEAVPDLPPIVDLIFARATARDPAMRYGTWEEFAADLRELSEPAGTAALDRHRTQLKALPFFHGFGDAALGEVVAMGRWFDLRAGSQLVGEDDPGYSFFILTRGQVRATRRGTLLAIRGAGECLAETSFLRKAAARRFSTLTAVTDCSLVEFDPDVLWLASPDCTRHFHEAFLTALATRLEGAESALAEMLAAKNVTLF